jgi:hypothetical protein
MYLLDVLHDINKTPPPMPCLNRVAKHFNADPEAFEAAWKALQLHKEVEIGTVLKEAEGRRSMPQKREDIPADFLWRRVYRTVRGEVADAPAATEASHCALELLLLLECTNAGVERDAGMKRNLDAVSQNRNTANVVDQRLRITVEGPSIETSKGNQCEHTVIVEAAKDYLAVKDRREQKHGERKRAAPKSEATKLAMRAAAKKPKTSHNTEEPDAKILESLSKYNGGAAEDGIEIAVLEEGSDDEVLDPNQFFGNLDELFDADPTGRSSGLASVAKPVPKKKRSGAKGKALDCLPKGAEEEEAVEEGPEGAEEAEASSEEEEEEADEGEEDDEGEEEEAEEAEEEEEEDEEAFD